MKIVMQNNLINTNAFSNVQSKDAQSSKDTQAPFFSKTEGDISVKVTFSDEGIEAYRKSVQEMGQQDETVDLDALDKMREYGDKIVMDPAHGMEADFHKRLLKLNSEAGESLEDWTKNCLTVYATMYDEIKKGYEQGTREYWVLADDGSTKDNWRKVTEEEELAALDKAFDFYSYVLDGYVNYGVKAGEDAERAIFNTQRQLENQPRFAAEQKDEAMDIYMKMKMAKKDVDEQYASKTINELVKDIFNYFFK